jgi:hypothetical protein
MEVFGYRIFAEGALDENFQLHVLARAYRDAWLDLKGQLPFGRHRLETLGVTIEFENPAKQVPRDMPG